MSWFPIFGSSPDAITPQIYNWANQSRAVEESNIARANAAERGQNDYFAKVAEMNRANTGIENQFVFDERNRRERDASNAETRANRRYEFGQDLKLRKDDLAAQIKDAAERVKALQAEEADGIKTAAEKLKLATESLVQKQDSALNAAVLKIMNANPGVEPTDDQLEEIKNAVANKTGPLHPDFKYDRGGSKRFKITPYTGLGNKWYERAPQSAAYDFTSATGTTPPPAPVIAPPVERPPATIFARGGATVMDFSERPIGTQEEYVALPPGARFVWTYPDGRKRRGRKP